MKLVEKNDLAGVRVLLAQAPQLANQPQGQFQKRPLHEARTPEMIRLLLDAGAQVDAPGWMGATPLFEAVQRDSAECVRALLEHGADVNFRREAGYTPLHFVNSPAVAEVLLGAGADQRARDSNGNTPAMRMAFDGKAAVLAFLLSRGGIVDDTPGIGGRTAVHDSAWKLGGSAEIMRLLLGAGLDPNAKDEEGTTPLMAAVGRSPGGGVIEVLLSRGARPELTDRAGCNALDAARRANDGAALALFEENLRSRGLLGTVPEKWQLRIVAAVAENEVVAVLPEGFLARFRAGTAGDLELIAQQPIQASVIAVARSGEKLYAIGHPGPVWEVPADLSSPPVLVPLSTGGLNKPFPRSGAVSPDGNFIAVAFDYEQVRLWNMASGAHADLPGGEGTLSVAFSPDSSMLAIAASFQGGGGVETYPTSVAGGIRLLPLSPAHEFSRSDTKSAGEDFVDTLAHVQFTPDGRRVLLFETSAIYHQLKSPGWRGNLVLLDLETGKVAAQAPLDAAATGDGRSLALSGHQMGYFTEPTIISGGRIACGSANGVVILYDPRTLEVVGKQRLRGPERSVQAVVELGGRLWGLTGDFSLQPVE